MPITKDRISSPLEAGPSILDAKQLPLQLTSALDYVSSRLARKRLHLSLIVVRKDVNILPQNPSPQTQSPKQAEPPGHSISTSPARSLFSSASSTFTKSLSKHSSDSSLSDAVSAISSSSASSLSRTRWPGLPSSPKDTSAAPSPSLSPSPSPPPLARPPKSLLLVPNPYGIRLMHASTITAKAEKILRRIIFKAEKKFAIGSGWLSSQPLTNTILCPATNDIIRRSLTQNEILFSSEGLTLLSLDHVYTFKCQLHTYSRTLSATGLTSAVDELRRLVLAQNGKKITKGYLMRAYDWLGVSLAALVDVNEGYKVAYGGKERRGGIEVQNEERQSPPPLKTNFDMKEIRRMKISVGFSPSESKRSGEDILKGSSDCSGSYNETNDKDGGEKAITLVEVGESAKGKDGDVRSLREDRGPHKRGAVTPNGFEDITPVTKGEWCFLMVGDGWKEARTAAVETC